MKKHTEIPPQNRGYILACPFLYTLFISFTPACSQEITHFITPRRTDERLAGGQPPHFIAVQRDGKKRNALFLFLPGTGNSPDAYCGIARLAAINGFHAVNLSYPNAISVNFTCTDENSLTCHQNMRTEIIWGTDLSDKIQVDSINCIQSRLVKLLDYCIEYFPHDGWNIYLDKKHLPAWSRIIVAGHSQGGGHAAFIGKKRATAGVVMFSSVDYCSTYDKPAPWLSAKGLTPPSRYSAMGHMRDRAFPLSLQLKAWRALNLTVTNPLVNVDTIGYPFKHAQALISDARPSRERPSETPFHNAVVVDYDTPKKEDGSLLFEDVWRYLLLRLRPPPPAILPPG
ncbi:MAG: hypothetical protein JW913_03300 [Chitinispirillaceae bacterium]|nr:hypothetical protein [Chitinispirillaceae bacterium]